MGQPEQRIQPIQRMKACLNGRRGHDEHPAIPVTPAELAAAAAGAAAAGAEAIHLHPRDAGGRESLLAADVGAAVAAVRQSCPGVPVGVTTGLWVTGGDPAARQAAVAGWVALPAEARPDFASVNLGEAGAADLPGMLAAAGIGAQAGVWSAADAVLGRLDELSVTLPRLLHGADESCWPLISHAGRLGLPARVGLEDTLAGPGGRPVSGNAELMELALAAWTAAAP